MKTTPGRPRTRYRNEAVFRSAQRLIASPPTLSPNPDTRSLSTKRGVVYLVVAALLFAAGVLVGLRWRASSSAATPVDLAQTGLVVDGSGRPAARDGASPATPEASARQSVVKPSSQTSQAPRSEPASSTPGTDYPPLGASRSAPSAAGAPAAATTALLSVAAGPEFTLRGRLNSDATPSAEPLELELSLRRDASVLTGFVRYFSLEGERVLAHAVKGEINAERVVELRETSPAWRRSTPFFSPPAQEPHRNFIFTLPATNTAGEFTGLWTSHARNDNSSGTLTLWFSAPW